MRFARPARLSLAGVLVLAACQDPVPIDKIPLQEVTAHELPSDDTPTTVAPGKTHHHDLELFSGDFVRVLVDQRSVDVAVRLVGPDGEEAASVDSPNGKDGFEELVTRAETPGRYRVEVVSLSKEPGKYVLAGLVHRPATAEDLEALEAERAFQAARKAKGEEAVELYKRSLTAWTRLGHTRRQIETLEALAWIFQASGDYPLAVAFGERSLALFRSQEDQRGMDRVLDLTGWLHLRRGQTERAVPYLEEAAESFVARGFARGAALAFRNLGDARHHLGDARGALAAFDKALGQAGASANPGTEAAVRASYGNVLLDLQRLTEAGRQLDRVLEIRREQGKEREIAIALEGVAFVAARLGERKRASTAIAEALRLADDSHPSTFETTRGLIHRLEGDVESAHRDYEEALRRAREAGSREGEWTALARLGQLHLEMDEPGEALRCSDTLLGLVQDVPRWEAVARIQGGRALAKLGRFTQAWQRIEPALSLVDRLRGAIDARGTRVDYFASRQAYFETAIDVLLQLHHHHPDDGFDIRAFAVNERRLVRELHESFALPQGPPATLSKLREEETRVESMLAEAALLPREDPRREERVRGLLAQLEKVNGELRQAALGEVVPAAPEIDLDDVQRHLLDPETLLLAYALGEEHSYVWMLSTDGLSVRELAPRVQIEERAVAWAESLQRSTSRTRQAGERLSRELAELVLDGVPLTHRRIALVLEGALQAVPFAALPRPTDGEPLVRRHEIVRVPSASALLESRRARPRQVSSSIALFADPVFDEDDPRVSGVQPAAAEVDADLLRAAEYLGVGSWERLKATGGEAETILHLYGRDALLAQGFEASRETLMSGRIRGRAILHFATHAVLAGDQPELSGLVLSLVDEEGRKRNGFVRAFEIARLHLETELVVLSACRTGLGRDVRGEGMQSLARAFLDAGAARVLYSLWEVPDRSTAELMSRFHAGLAVHGEPASALREAQLEMLEKGIDPYRWAGFVLLGDWRGFDTKGAKDGKE